MSDRDRANPWGWDDGDDDRLWNPPTPKAEPEEEPERFMICSSPEKVPVEHRIPGSVETRCHLCGCALIMAPSGHKLVEKEGAKPICMACLHGLPSEEVDQADIEITPEQVQELILKFLKF